MMHAKLPLKQSYTVFNSALIWLVVVISFWVKNQFKTKQEFTAIAVTLP